MAMSIEDRFRSAASVLWDDWYERDTRNAVYVWAATAFGILLLSTTAIRDHLYWTAWLATVKFVVISLAVVNLIVMHWRRNVVLAENVVLLLTMGQLIAVF